METWLVIWVLTMSYCQSPEGKTACEPVEDTYRFTEMSHCEIIRDEMVKSYDKYTNVILYKDKTKCKPIVQLVAEVEHFDSKEEADAFAIKQLVHWQLLMESNTDE